MHGVDIAHFKARQVSESDFRHFTYILAMDHENLRNLRAMALRDSSTTISLLMDMVPGREGAAIADPYYDGEENFRDTWADVSEAAQAISARLTAD